MAAIDAPAPARRRRFGCLPRAVGWALIAVIAAAAIFGGAWLSTHARAIRRLAAGGGDTVFLDAAGSVWFPLDARRVDVPLTKIAPALRQAVVAAEDRRFWSHRGIDPLAVGRAALHNLRRGAATEGASTITQQLARTLFLSRERTVSRKLREAALAVLIEGLLPKERILELYLNRVPLGAVHGVEAFALETFGRHAAELSLAEAAMLAGIIRAPSAFGPRAHYDRALGEARRVLGRMRAAGMIDAAAEAAALAARPRIAAGVPPGRKRSGWAQDYLRRAFRDRAGDEDPPGWRVRTTFSRPLQAAAEEAVAAGVARLKRPRLQAALVALDPQTGDLRAMVGGADYEQSTYNRAVLASRQPGSAFKPFVYAVALARGASPATRVPGVLSRAFAQESERLGTRLDGDDPAALVTYREALAVSDNDAALAVHQGVGTAAVADLARRAGLPPQPEVPSLALGTGSATPLELTVSYAPFANGGHAVRPRSIIAVEDHRGRTVLREEGDRTAIVSAAVAWQMLSMLREVVESGTGGAARAAGVPAAGKTGTTDDYHDAWFVGFASGLAVGVWVGFDRPAPIGEAAYAAQVAVPIWTDFVRRAASLLPQADFSPPSVVTAVALCAISHAVPTDGCPSYQEYFKPGDSVPEERCPLHPGSLRERLGRSIRWFFDRIRGLFR